METYCLKEKILINKEFLSNLESKSWLEIESLQSQIANIEPSAENSTILQLLKNLLTSYYVFIGGLENLSADNSPLPLNTHTQLDKEIETPYSGSTEKRLEDSVQDEIAPDNFEPFEYFVDFDEPSGEPLSDEDLYS